MRRLIINLLRLANQLWDPANLADEVIQIIGFIKDSVISLDSYTTELASYIVKVNKSTKGKQPAKIAS